MQPVEARTVTSGCGRVLIAAVLAMAVFTSRGVAQQTQCDQGIIRLPYGVNGTMEICPAISSQAPALQRQLAELSRAQGNQAEQTRELTRLIKNLNSVSENIGTQRQGELLRNLSLQLRESQAKGQAQTQQQITELAERLDGLKDLMIQKIGNRATADKANAAIEGSVGDAIAKLDLTSARALLENIQQELTAIHSDTRETNERTKQIQTSIEDLGIDPAKIRDALVAADMHVLRRLDFSKVSPSVIEATLRQIAPGEKTSVARQFFESSIDSSGAIAWLQSAIAAGLNPNLRVASDYYAHESMLNEAVRAGNVSAAKMLLASGASPHAYQDLHLTSYATTRFIFPLQGIASDEHLRLQTKQEIAKAFVAAGAVIPRVIVKGDSYMSVMFSAKQQMEQAGSTLGVTLTPSPTLCEQTRTPICRNASARTGVDWCAAIAAMPRKLTYTSYGSGTPLYDIELRYLLAIDGGDAYFLGYLKSYGPDYVLVQVSRDGSSWKVLRFMEPETAMGLCKKDDDGYQPTACWREIDLVRQGTSNVMRLASWGVSWAIVPDPCAPDKSSSTAPHADDDVERSLAAASSARTGGTTGARLEEAQAEP